VRAEVRRALLAVAARLDGAGVPFALGGSGLLCALGLADDVADLDLMLQPTSRDALREAAGAWWRGLDASASERFASAFRARLDVGGIEVDAIGGFSLRRGARIVRLPFRQETWWTLDGVGVPLAPVEQWWLIYRGHKPDKADLLEPRVSPARRAALLRDIGEPG
jgi:hypothetical protein